MISCVKDTDDIYKTFLYTNNHVHCININQFRDNNGLIKHLDSISCENSDLEFNKLPFLVIDIDECKFLDSYNVSNYKVGLLDYPCHHKLYDVRYGEVISVRIDSSGSYFSDGLEYELDSLVLEIELHIFNFLSNSNYSTSPARSILQLNIDDLCDTKPLEVLLSKVVKMHKRNVESLTITRYNKPLIKCTSNEIDSLRHELPLNIWIDSNKLRSNRLTDKIEKID